MATAYLAPTGPKGLETYLTAQLDALPGRARKLTCSDGMIATIRKALRLSKRHPGVTFGVSFRGGRVAKNYRYKAYSDEVDVSARDGVLRISVSRAHARTYTAEIEGHVTVFAPLSCGFERPRGWRMVGSWAVSP